MNNSVLSRLIRINHQWHRVCRSELIPYNYVGVMHLIVIYIDHNPGSCQEDIASYYSLDKTGVARDARRLEDMGHIRREIMPESRRQYRLYLTEKGEDMIEVLKKIYNDFQNKLSASMTSEDWRTLNNLLGYIDEYTLSKKRQEKEERKPSSQSNNVSL